jgi:hypothetical protein
MIDMRYLTRPIDKRKLPAAFNAVVADKMIETVLQYRYISENGWSEWEDVRTADVTWDTNYWSKR